jgi:superoxide reductase
LKSLIKSDHKKGEKMKKLKDLYQEGDWKLEKHVPLIEVVSIEKQKDVLSVTISVGKEVPHPNTTEHHIRYVSVFFLPENEKFPVNIGLFEFNAHGESSLGPNTSTIFTDPKVVMNFRTEKSGVLTASSFCNIHGLWENSVEIKAK